MIRPMRDSDWPRVAEIYTRGLEGGRSTFHTDCPTFARWAAGHLKDCRLVAESDGRVVGWAALSATSARPAYRGVVEVSIYVDTAFQGRGTGTALLTALCKASEAAGYWCLYSAIFSVNTASIALHKKCGFREIGCRERIARDKVGVWQNTTLMERRKKDREP